MSKRQIPGDKPETLSLVVARENFGTLHKGGISFIRKVGLQYEGFIDHELAALEEIKVLQPGAMAVTLKNIAHVEEVPCNVWVI